MVIGLLHLWWFWLATAVAAAPIDPPCSSLYSLWFESGTPRLPPIPPTRGTTLSRSERRFRSQRRASKNPRSGSQSAKIVTVELEWLHVALFAALPLVTRIVVNRTRFVLGLILALALTAVVSTQGSGQNPSVVQETVEAHPPNPKGSNPKPEDATKAILAAFDRYEVVGMDAAHGNKDLDDFILHLVRDPAFPGKVNDIAVECGNSLYQGLLDRYIAGEDVPLSEVRPVWRNTTALMCSVSGFYEELFPLVRRINQKLSPGRQLRILAGDPPLDWSKVKDRSEVMLDRDASVASVMQKEVLSKHRKALMLFGTFHLFHTHNSGLKGMETAVQRYEKHYPGVTLVIGDGLVFYDSTDLANYDSHELEARMASWPVPSLVQNIEGTWLAEVDKTYFSTMVDAYLYLGPSDLLLLEPRPAEIFSNKDYVAELQRRVLIIGDALTAGQANPDKLSDQDFSPFLIPDTSHNMQSLGINPSQSVFAPPQAAPPSRPPALPQVIRLSPEALHAFIGKYAAESPSGLTIPPFEVDADRDGLWVDVGAGSVRHKFVAVSSDEFMDNDAPSVRITFIQDERGHTVGLIFKGILTIHANKLP
jgi:hypothetical protein